MAEALIARLGLNDLVTALSESPIPPCRRVMLKADQRWVAGRPGIESRRRLATQNPPWRGYCLAWVLNMAEHPDQDLQEDLRLGVSAHGAEDSIQHAVSP